MRARSLFLAASLGALVGCSASTESTEIGVRTVNVALFGSPGVMEEIYPPGATYIFLRSFSDWSVYDVGLQKIGRAHV